MTIPTLDTIALSVENGIAHVELNRPDKANAMNQSLWQDFGDVFEWIEETPAVRVVVISGRGKHFCAGIDLTMFAGLMMQNEVSCEGRLREQLRKQVLWLQSRLTAIEKCGKPVIAAMHGASIGAAIDMTSACDMRFCVKNTTFSIKEIDIGMTADVGTLQRLPGLIGDGIMRELAYTGRDFDGDEAKAIGFVNQVYNSKEEMMVGVMELAKTIASKSPLSIRGTKEMILYTRDNGVEAGLNYVATWNAAMILSADIKEAMMAKMEGRKPTFED